MLKIRNIPWNAQVLFFHNGLSKNVNRETAPRYKYSHYSISKDASCAQRVLLLPLSFLNPNFISGMGNTNLRSSFLNICFHGIEDQ